MFFLVETSHIEIAEVNSLQENFIKEKRGSQPCCPLNSICIGNYLRPPIDAQASATKGVTMVKESQYSGAVQGLQGMIKN